MRIVQTTCSQCGGSDTYLEPETGDYTGVPCGVIFHQFWKCCYCGYPEIVWTKYGFQYRPQEIQTGEMRIKDEQGNTITVNRA